MAGISFQALSPTAMIHREAGHQKEPQHMDAMLVVRRLDNPGARLDDTE